ncbi:hypothetical protein IGI65_001347 [Enterococcus sp. DIV0755b]|uniref:daptomycin-sensing surface protein LiaX n=1 Tax=Enterococcus sp. DIV0755b TaxID=2774657 RepID=UPI003F212DEA
MNERERILDLVKKGVLSTEEALDLLESMATARDEKQIKKASESIHADTVEDNNDTVDDKSAAKKEVEDILDNLATEAGKASAELDELNVEIAGVKEQLAEVRHALMEYNTKEELEMLSESEVAQRHLLEEDIKDLEASLDDLIAEKVALEAQLKDIKKDQWQEAKEKLATKIDLPDDWKEQATDAINQAGEKMAEAGTHLGRFLKQTFQTVSETVNDNVEWKDISLKVPGVATTKFEHTFEYPETKASILDVKVANGNIRFELWDEAGVKVDAKVKLYGKMNEATPFEAFEARSKIEVDDDHISFQVPNKRVRADLVFYLPKRIYDHVSLRLLNGDVTVKELDAKDVYTKSTNGNIEFQTINATMLEIEGVNGAIDVFKGSILDSIIETVNGTVTMTTTPQTLGVSLVNGDVRLTFKENNLKKVSASSVNGNVKIALPASLGVEGNAKTSLGSINSRMTDYDVVREKKEKMNQMLQFRRLSEEEVAHVELTTTTGNIFLKDAE